MMGTQRVARTEIEIDERSAVAEVNVHQRVLAKEVLQTASGLTAVVTARKLAGFESSKARCARNVSMRERNVVRHAGETNVAHGSMVVDEPFHSPRSL